MALSPCLPLLVESRCEYGKAVDSINNSAFLKGIERRWDKEPKAFTEAQETGVWRVLFMLTRLPLTGLLIQSAPQYPAQFIIS